MLVIDHGPDFHAPAPTEPVVDVDVAAVDVDGREHGGAGGGSEAADAGGEEVVDEEVFKGGNVEGGMEEAVDGGH